MPHDETIAHRIQLGTLFVRHRTKKAEEEEEEEKSETKNDDVMAEEEEEEEEEQHHDESKLDQCRNSDAAVEENADMEFNSGSRSSHTAQEEGNSR